MGCDYSKSNQIRPYIPVEIEVNKNYVDIVIDRPHKNNTLTPDMARKIQYAINELKTHSNLKAAFIHKSEGLAFCGGGDLGIIMKEEYSLENNYQYEISRAISMISRAKAPVVAVLDGLVKGSGVGFSYFASIKIATENTVLALPEAKFGYIPDAAGGWYLPRLKEGLGLFMMLTGTPIKGEDLVRTGLAHYYIESKKLEKLRKDLISHLKEDSTEETLRKIIEKYNKPVSGEFSLKPFIKEHFDGKESVEEVIKSLEQKAGEDAQAKETMDYLLTLSPQGLKANFELYQRGKNIEALEDVLRLEWNVGKKLRAHQDVIRSTQRKSPDQVIEWAHKSLAEVTKEEIAEIFKLSKLTRYQTKEFLMDLSNFPLFANTK